MSTIDYATVIDAEADRVWRVLRRLSAKSSGLSQHRSNIVLKENDAACISATSPTQRLRRYPGKMVVM